MFRILDTLHGYLQKIEDAFSDIAIPKGPRGRQGNRRRPRSRGGARNHRFRLVLEQFCLMVSVPAGQPVGFADTRPGCAILDTFDELAERNRVSPREKANQGVESLIHSQDWRPETVFRLKKKQARV